MMDKYFAFRKMLDFVSEYADVTDADMNFCGDRLLIEGENDGQVITIEVIIKNKEDNNND